MASSTPPAAGRPTRNRVLPGAGFPPVTAKLSSRGPGVPTETGVQSVTLGPSARNGWFRMLLNVSVEICQPWAPTPASQPSRKRTRTVWPWYVVPRFAVTGTRPG